MSDRQAPIEVFLSYATEDESLCEDLEKHLSQLRHDGLIAPWHKRQIPAGQDWSKALDEHLNTASVILLLVSADFLASDYCYGTEMMRAMQRHDANEAHTIPILLRSVDWQSAPFGKLQALPSDGRPVMSWSNRDEAFADVAKSIRVLLKEMPVSTSPTTLPQVWNIPYARNPVFTGCKEALAQLAKTLKKGQPTALSQPHAICGLGGIGKTQIAIEYAYRHRKEYRVVFWARADTHEALVSDYITLAELLNLPEKDLQDQTITVQAVKRWLTTHKEWLLILDNADDLKTVEEFLPASFNGHLLLTTREQAIGQLAERIEVETMEPDIGALLLLRRIGLVTHSASLGAASLADVEMAHEITKELGGLPLALDQAGAYIQESRCGLTGYLQCYRKDRGTLLQHRGRLVINHPESVVTTWSLSFRAVKKKSLAAAELLQLCAFLQPDTIPEQLLIEGAEHIGRRLRRVITDPLSFNEVIEILQAYSLIRRDSNILRIHRLVQAVIRDNMSEGVLGKWITRCISLLESVFPSKTIFSGTKNKAEQEKKELWKRTEQLTPHALVAAALTSTILDRSFFPFPQDRAVSLFSRVAQDLEERGQYSDAEALYRLTLHIQEQASGTQDLFAASLCIRLANLYGGQSKYEEAELFYRSAFHIREQVLSSKHPDVAAPLFGLAALYKEQKRYDEAKLLYQQAQHIWMEALGSVHHLTVECSDELAKLPPSEKT